MKIIRFLAAVMLINLSACANKEEFVIFSTARAQGQIQAPDNFLNKNYGGFASLKNIFQSEQLPNIKVDLGNWSTDTPKGRLTKGLSVIDAMNNIPYEIATAGITDINLGEKDFGNLVNKSSFTVLASNLYLRDGSVPGGISKHKIIELKNHKLGFFSLLVPDTKKIDKQKYYPSYKIDKCTYDSYLAINALKHEKADLIILLLSIGTNENTERKFYSDFIEKVPNINLIITDDPKIIKPLRIGKTRIVSAGLNNKYAERTKITINSDTGKIIDIDSKKIPADPLKYGESEDILRLVMKYRIEEEKYFSKIIGTLRNPIPLKDGEIFDMANFTADCVKLWSKNNAAIIPVNETATGFTNTNIKLSELYKAFPNDSSIVFVKIRGENLIASLQSLIPGTYAVSGLKIFYYNNTVSRVESLAGPIIADKLYHVAIPDSMINSTNVNFLANASEFSNTQRPTRSIMQWCVGSRYTFTPHTQRIFMSGEL